MAITKDMVVSLAYQVKDQDGALVDESSAHAPLQYLHGYNNLIVGLENALEGKKAGESFSITVEPELAYGPYLDGLVQRVPAEVFQGADELEVGMRFIADTDQGHLPVEITAIEGDEVVVDGNHMLAGQTLSFDVTVVDVREATAEELAHGHVHQAHSCCGGHGHSHDDDHECCGGHGHAHDGHECCGGHGHAHDDHECCGGHGHKEEKPKKEGCCGSCH
ncbi:MAG: peptidylprolyl isomerase [Vibrionaceae bacterium]